jgi:hypothetical protein
MTDLSPEDLTAARQNPTSLHFAGMIHQNFDHAAHEAWKERGREFEREQYAKNPAMRAEAVARATKSRKRRKAEEKPQPVKQNWCRGVQRFDSVVSARMANARDTSANISPTMTASANNSVVR